VDLVATRAAAGLLLASLEVGAFAALSRLAGVRRALVFPAVPLVAASILSWQALVRWTWAPLAVMVLVGVAAAATLRRTAGPARRRPALIAVLALVLLGLDALYAALPDYRYDQWNYHLVVAKAVKTGPLAPPILNDHVAFTGVWEYLFTVPRALSDDDMFNQSAVDAFTWLLVAAGLYAFARRFGRDVFPRGPAPLLIVAWTMAGLPDEAALMNAKPDPLLLLAAIAVADLLSRPSRERSWLDAALLGFYLAAPLAAKVTWLHFAAVAVPVAAWAWRPPWPRGHVVAALTGLLAGVATAAPFLVKNSLLFGNPLHPVQWGPFRSSFWTPAMAEYWRALMAPARDLGAWWATLVRVPLALQWHLWALTLPVLLLALVGLVRRFRRRREPWPGGGASSLLRVALALAFLHVLLWPLFFRASIGARFVFPGLAAVVLVLWVVMGRVFAAGAGPSPSRLAAFLLASTLLLPGILLGHVPTKAVRLATWGTWSVDRFVREGPAQWRMLHDLWSIDRDRRATLPDARFGEGTTLVDTKGTYLLDGASVNVWSVEYTWYRARATCLWDLLLQLDVRYVFARTGDFDAWPAELRPLAAALTPLSSLRQAYAVDRGFLERRRADDPACAASSRGEAGGEASAVSRRGPGDRGRAGRQRRDARRSPP
jgi:hypothetical protein